MFSFRDRVGRVEVAFTNRHDPAGGPLNLSLVRDGCAVAGPPPGGSMQAVADAFADGEPPVGLVQVHGGDVLVLDQAYDGREVEADAVVTGLAGRPLLVRAADCVPVLLADPDEGVIGAAHAGRPGLVAEVVPHAVASMRDLGATRIRAWVGPHVCGSCYEVPEQMRSEVAAVVPESYAVTSWGTPALDIGAGVLAQLRALDVEAVAVGGCTREDPDLWSHRRDGREAGRLGGLVRLVP